MANGHTTGVVRVRSLTVVVMRHCFDDLAETASAKVCEAFTATYVPLISSAMSLRFFSSILEMPGSPVSGSTTQWSVVLESPALTPSAMTGILPPSVEPTPTVNPSLRYWRSDENVRRVTFEVCSPSVMRYSTIASSGCASRIDFAVSSN